MNYVFGVPVVRSDIFNGRKLSLLTVDIPDVKNIDAKVINLAGDPFIGLNAFDNKAIPKRSFPFAGKVKNVLTLIRILCA